MNRNKIFETEKKVKKVYQKENPSIHYILENKKKKIKRK